MISFDMKGGDNSRVGESFLAHTRSFHAQFVSSLTMMVLLCPSLIYSKQIMIVTILGNIIHCDLFLPIVNVSAWTLCICACIMSY